MHMHSFTTTDGARVQEGDKTIRTFVERKLKKTKKDSEKNFWKPHNQILQGNERHGKREFP